MITNSVKETKQQKETGGVKVVDEQDEEMVRQNLKKGE